MNLKLPEGARVCCCSHSQENCYLLDFRRNSYLSFVTLRVTSCVNPTGIPQNKSFVHCWPKAPRNFCDRILLTEMCLRIYLPGLNQNTL